MRAHVVKGMLAVPAWREAGWASGKNASRWLHKESLCLVQFQFVLCHPSLHVRDARLHGQDSGVHLTGIFYEVIRQISMLFMDNKDSVSVLITEEDRIEVAAVCHSSAKDCETEGLSFNQRGERCRAKNEEDRTQNWALWEWGTSSWTVYVVRDPFAKECTTERCVSTIRCTLWITCPISMTETRRMIRSQQILNRTSPIGCTSGGVYVPCIYTHARWKLP